MPGAISLGGIFLVTLIEMVFSPVRLSTGKPPKEKDQESAVEDTPEQPPQPVHIPGGSSPAEPCDCDRSTHLRPKGPLVGRASSFSRSINRIEGENDGICRISSAPEAHTLPQISEVNRLNDHRKVIEDDFQLSEKQKWHKDVMQVFMLEVGILFHSVFIGMSLSVSVGNEFVVLLIAIAFHRMFPEYSFVRLLLTDVETFEGLALGSRIACLEWPQDAAQPWLMSLAYGCTYVTRTPIILYYLY